MRHRKLNTKLNRTNKHRKATVSNIMRGLFTSERIVTTIKKAKVTSRYADKVITLAKQNDLAAIRQVEKIFQDKDLIHKLFHEIGPRFTERNGGYTRVLRYKTRRGDGTEMAILELTEKEIMSPEERAPKTKSKKQKEVVSDETSVATEEVVETQVEEATVTEDEVAEVVEEATAEADAEATDDVETPEDATDTEEEDKKSSE